MPRQLFMLLPGLLFAGLVACSDSSDTPPVAPSSLTIVANAVPEGAPGEMPTLRFRITLDLPQPRPVNVSFQTAGVTATAGDDYLDTVGDVSIPAGALEAFIPVDVIGDAEEEAAETFTLNYAVTGNAVAIADATTGTIANDDTACDAPFELTENPWRVNGGDPLNYAPVSYTHLRAHET